MTAEERAAMLTPDPEAVAALIERMGAMAGTPYVPVPEPDLEAESRESGLISATWTPS